MDEAGSGAAAAFVTKQLGEAYDVSRALVEDVKCEVPIWKHQHEADGAASWVGLP